MRRLIVGDSLTHHTVYPNRKNWRNKSSKEDMDSMEDYRLISALRRGVATDLDVYDAAA